MTGSPQPHTPPASRHLPPRPAQQQALLLGLSLRALLLVLQWALLLGLPLLRGLLLLLLLLLAGTLRTPQWVLGMQGVLLLALLQMRLRVLLQRRLLCLVPHLPLPCQLPQPPSPLQG